MSESSRRRFLRRFDWVLMAIVAALLVISFLTLHSATLHADGSPNHAFLNRQLVGLAAGLLGLLLVNTLDHHEFPELSRLLYWLAVAALVAVLLTGRVVNGARSWFSIGGFSLQPSELAKIAVLVALSRFFTVDEADGSDVKDILRSAAIVGLPLLLILAQPDLGTGLTFIGLWLVMLWWGGARWWQLLAIVLLGLAAFALMWSLGLLHDYQKARITVLFTPDADPRGQGYNLRQCLIAVGSGGLHGKGWLQGTQAHLGFIPEQRTDFIFAVLAEERGFIGSVAVLGLYAGLFLRGLHIVASADSPFGRTLAVGALTVLFWHVFLNTGMVLGLLPITGLPLPFFSYGGSNLLTSLVLLGIVLNVAMRKQGINVR